MPRQPRPLFTYSDLFAGIGGFHAALSALGGACLYAVENNRPAATVYAHNWEEDPYGDITDHANDQQVTAKAGDVLAAGFPCQPFSKSGAQRGMDETRGTLFWNIAKLVEDQRPKVLLLENVRNLAGPRHTHEWQVIIETLRDLDYRVSDVPAVFSPHLLRRDLGGRPQVRERVFITATYNPAGNPFSGAVPPVVTPKSKPEWLPTDEWDLETDLPLDPNHHADDCDLTDDEKRWINGWDAFVKTLRGETGRRLPGFPLWVDSWGPDALIRIDDETPAWKRDHIRKNVAFYEAWQHVIDPWLEEWDVYSWPPSRRKLEWQAQDVGSLWETVMHLRPSGLRAKRPTYVPALVAITQTSIVGPRERRLSPREAARLQGLPDWYDFGDQPTAETYRQLGNGVNVGVVWHVLREHVKRDRDILATTCPGLVKAIDSAPANPDDALAALGKRLGKVAKPRVRAAVQGRATARGQVASDADQG